MADVEASQQNPVWRTDAFQDAVTIGSTALFVGAGGVVVEVDGDTGAMARTLVSDAASPHLIEAARCGDDVYALGADATLWERTAVAAWTRKPIDTQEDLQDLTCAPDGALWVAGSFGTMLVSRDGGDTWTSFSLDDDIILTGVSFPTAATGVAVGEFGTVLRSDDGGASWENLASSPPEFYPLAMYFADPAQGWIAGLGGEIHHTDDGGESWAIEPTPTDAPLYRIAPLNGELYAIGASGAVLRRAPAGRWESVEWGGGFFGFLRAVTVVEGVIYLGGQSLITSLPDVEPLSISAREGA